MIRHIYSLRIDHHGKSSNHLSPYKVITILLTILSMLYFIFPWIIYLFIYLFIFNFFFFNLFIYSFLAVLGPRFCARAPSSRGKRGPLPIAVRRPLTITAPPVVKHRLQPRRLSSCGSRAQPLRRMWDPPRPGLEPVFPALAGRLSTTAPPGKPWIIYFTTGSLYLLVPFPYFFSIPGLFIS